MEKEKTFAEQIAAEIDNQTAAGNEQQQPTPTERRCVRASDLLRRKVTELPKLFAPVFPAVGIAMLGGESDSGKSMLLRNMAICTATGRDFLGWKYQGTRQNCIFVSTEDDEDATSFLLSKHNATFTDYADEWNRLRFIFDFENLIPTLDAELTEEPADLVIIDAYLDVFDGNDQNNAAQNRKFVKSFDCLAQKHKCLICFLHHTGKGKENLPPSKNNFIGSQSLEAKIRLGVEFRVDRHDDTLRHFCIVKANGLNKAEYKKDSFVLQMDENLVYHNTGERVPFEELGNPDVINRAGRKSKDVTKISDEDYMKTFDEIFAGGKLTKNTLKAKLRNSFGGGTDVVERMIEYAEDRGWIENVSANPNKFEYERR